MLAGLQASKQRLKTKMGLYLSDPKFFHFTEQ